MGPFYVIEIKGLLQGSLSNFASGVAMLAGAVDGRSAKKRLGRKTDTKANLVLEAMGLLLIALLVLLGLASGLWYEHPLPFVLIPIWSLAAYFVALRKPPHSKN